MFESYSSAEGGRSYISYNPPMKCDQSCMATIKKTATIVTGLDEAFQYQTGDRTLLSLFKVLHQRACRLVHDKNIRRRLNPILRTFVCNLIMHFRDSGELDDFTLTNLITALSLSDTYDKTPYGTVDYSTLIRRPNPTQPDSDNFFIVGREGRINDPACPMKQLEANPRTISQVPREQLSVFIGFFHARQMDPSRGAPKIGVEDFRDLVPSEIKADPNLEEAFTDVCFSDGAWELYQRKVAA